ncbi:MAG: hypothetical protein PHN72_01315 [Bacilli bacterium]|nr:hypothetical protein [Bacilli bacterium]
MNNIQEALDEINSKINKIKKRIELIELIDVSSKYNGVESPYQVDRKYSLDFDLNNRELHFVFNNILNDLIEIDFRIDLNISKMEKEINVELDSLSNLNLNNIELLKTKSLIGILGASYDYLKSASKSKEVNILDMLLENKKTDLILEIIVSDKVKINQKKYLLNQMINKYPYLVSSFDNMPALFYYAQECDYKKLYEEKFGQSLHLIFNNKEENIEIVRNNLTVERKDEITKINRSNVIKFFIDKKLVDINKINWNHKNYSVISFAAASFVCGFDNLGKFIYSMKGYKKIDNSIRDDSDKLIIDILTHNLGCSESVNDLFKLIENPNFECSPEKFDYLINFFLKEYIGNPTELVKEEINRVVNILLRKTKKEDYKIIKEYIKKLNINMNSDLLKQKRKKITNVLSVTNDSLMEQVPAKTKIKNIEFQQKKVLDNSTSIDK